MTPEQMARLVAGDFDCHDYVEINVGGTGPNEADFETLDTPGVVIRELATKITTLQQEKAALEGELAKWRKSFDGHVYVTNEKYSALVTRAEQAERERDTAWERARQAWQEESPSVHEAWVAAAGQAKEYIGKHGAERALRKEAEATTRRLEQEIEQLKREGQWMRERAWDDADRGRWDA
jgi:chromosome segregation ATPase